MTVNAAFVGILGLASVPPDTGANLNGNPVDDGNGDLNPAPTLRDKQGDGSYNFPFGKGMAADALADGRHSKQRAR